MLTKAIKGFRADIVLDAAGILISGLLANPHPDKYLCQAVMPVVSFFRNQPAFGCQVNVFVGIQFEVAIFREASDLLADGRAGELHSTGNINGAYIALFLLEN